MKRLVFLILLAATVDVSASAKCSRSDAGPVLQVALDAACAGQWIGHEAKWLGRTIKHLAVRAVRGLD